MLRKLSFAAFLFLFSGMLVSFSAQAQPKDGPECFSEYTRTNVCAKAREISAGITPSLPMLINANMTLSSIVGVGPRLVTVVVWHMKKNELERRIVINGTSLEKMKSQMRDGAYRSVCSEERTEAFVGLGGEVQYFYKTTDGFVIASPLVVRCE